MQSELVLPEFELAGAIAADNFVQWQARGERYIDDSAPDSPIIIRLDQVERSNSLVVALLLAWVRYATGLQKSVQFAQPPLALRNIIQFSGLTQILPLQLSVQTPKES